MFFGQDAKNIASVMFRVKCHYLIIVVACCLALFIGWSTASATDTEPRFSDQKITEAVENALLVDENVPSDLIDVQTHQGIVTLVGNVPHYRVKERAAQLVETLIGVESVINGLTVKSTERSGEDILGDVQRVLREDPVTDSYDINPSVKDGLVTLSGTVPSWAAKELSAWVASGVLGVRDIHNSLLIELDEQRSDNTILKEIQKRLNADVWVNDESILLSVEDGVVVLDGVVGSVAEKRRVSRNVRVAGVKDVDERLLFVKSWAQGDKKRQAKSGYRSDSEIKETLELAYLYDPRVSVFNPTISVDQGIVTLSGLVNNLKAKRVAEDTAKHTRGVLWVKNFLKVRPGGAMPDEELSRKVQLVLHDDPFVNGLNIGVFVLNGRVILHGPVDSTFQIQQAEEVVSSVKGVVAVKNNLRALEGWVWKPDPIIKREIENELWWSPYIESDDITVSVKEGVATLSGTVDNYFEHEIAIENGREGGAKSVISQLTIRKYLESEVLSDAPL